VTCHYSNSEKKFQFHVHVHVYHLVSFFFFFFGMSLSSSLNYHGPAGSTWRSYLLCPLYAAPPSQQVGSTGVWAPPVVRGALHTAGIGDPFSSTWAIQLSINANKLPWTSGVNMGRT
jgi:hypothetical protein